MTLQSPLVKSLKIDFCLVVMSTVVIEVYPKVDPLITKYILKLIHSNCHVPLSVIIFIHFFPENGFVWFEKDNAVNYITAHWQH